MYPYARVVDERLVAVYFVLSTFSRFDANKSDNVFAISIRIDFHNFLLPAAIYVPNP